MYSGNGYLGCTCSLETLRAENDSLNAQVVEQINDSQELMMLNNFARESNEYQFKKCLQERISDIASWQWVLEDLAKRLDEAVGALQHEHNALRVVVSRVQNEIDAHSREGSRPGALRPLSDSVEDAIIEEYNFLRGQRKKFELMIPELEKQMKIVERIKKRIQIDTLHKQKAISVEEKCAKLQTNTSHKTEGKKKKQRGSVISCWENRCYSLKKSGLQALSNALVTRQQVRGARIQLSISAQAYAARVDSILRRRQHLNKIKLQDLQWQREEAIRDLDSLNEELRNTEENILETMNQERVMVARLADRTLRPARELTKDDVDRSLRDELGRLRNFLNHLRNNIQRIKSLQNNLDTTIANIDCCAEDLSQIIRLDDERIRSRMGGDNVETSDYIPPSSSSLPAAQNPRSRVSNNPLTSIREEEEDDDYPFIE